jgi:hypothetical protein
MDQLKNHQAAIDLVENLTRNDLLELKCISKPSELTQNCYRLLHLVLFPQKKMPEDIQEVKNSVCMSEQEDLDNMKLNLKSKIANLEWLDAAFYENSRIYREDKKITDSGSRIEFFAFGNHFFNLFNVLLEMKAFENKN